MTSCPSTASSMPTIERRNILRLPRKWSWTSPGHRPARAGSAGDRDLMGRLVEVLPVPQIHSGTFGFLGSVGEVVEDRSRNLLAEALESAVIPDGGARRAE